MAKSPETARLGPFNLQKIPDAINNVRDMIPLPFQFPFIPPSTNALISHTADNSRGI